MDGTKSLRHLLRKTQLQNASIRTRHERQNRAPPLTKSRYRVTTKSGQQIDTRTRIVQHSRHLLMSRTKKTTVNIAIGIGECIPANFYGIFQVRLPKGTRAIFKEHREILKPRRSFEAR